VGPRLGQEEARGAAHVQQTALARPSRRQVAVPPQLAPRLRAARGLLADIVAEDIVVAAGV